METTSNYSTISNWWIPYPPFQFVAFLAVVAVTVTATKVDNYAEQKYDTTEVEYAHHYQPQQQHHEAPVEVEHHHRYHHQQPAAASESHGEKQHYKHIPILKSESQQGKDGSYKFQFEGANGIQQQEHGYVKNAGQKDHEIQVAEGYYSYVDEHGHPITVHYIADENGFRATGDHLPTPPPLPEALREAYEKVAAHPELYQEEEEHEQHHHQQQQQHEEQPQQSYGHVAYHQAPQASAAGGAAHYHRHAAPVAHQEYSHTESEDYRH